jgi:hypothetical protein
MVFKKKKYGGSSGCRSENIMPKDCETKKDYKLQSLIFHPDKNKDCSAEATQKFQYFQNLPSCILVKDQQKDTLLFAQTLKLRVTRFNVLSAVNPVVMNV